VTRATLGDGSRDGVLARVGADLRLTSGGLGDAQAAALAPVPGSRRRQPVTFEREAPFFVIRPGRPTASAGTTRVTVVAVDPRRLADVQRDVPDRPALPPGFAAPWTTGPTAPTSCRGRPSDSAAPATTSVPSGRRAACAARCVAGLDEFPGAPPGRSVVLVVGSTRCAPLTGAVLSGRSCWHARRPWRTTRRSPPAFSAGCGGRPAPDRDDAGRLARRATRRPRWSRRAGRRPGGGRRRRACWRRWPSSSTLLGGARRGGGSSRTLRALGLSGRQAGTLVALEVLPGAVAALAAGLVAGLATAWLVLPAADLRPLTGAVTETAVVVRPGRVAAVAAGFAAVLALGVLGAALEQRRSARPPAARLGDAE
jgi:hypothetical protein